MPGQSSRSFTERVALVTGGGRGAGRAVALQLALEGAFVIVSYEAGDAESASIVGELQRLGTLAHAAEGDASKADDVADVFRFVEETYGRLDMLVNAAGGGEAHVPFDALSEEEWDATLNLSLKSAFLCSRAAARLMSKRPSPAIVNLATESGLTGDGPGAHHVAAQAGVIGLTKALARELAPRIRVNCVAAAYIGEDAEYGVARDVEAAEASSDPSVSAAAIQPARRTSPDEVARACVYLLSSEAGAISGQTIVVGHRQRKR